MFICIHRCGVEEDLIDGLTGGSGAISCDVVRVVGYLCVRADVRACVRG